MKKSKVDLFLELAQPNEKGESRWVYTTEFIGDFADLQLGNGCDFARKSSQLCKKYIVEFDKTLTSGNRIDAIRLVGLNKEVHFNQKIRKDIREEIKSLRCVMLGVNGTSENTLIEVDHKDGRKNDSRISDLSSQKLSDFQPLCKAANDIKRQICKVCKETDKRWDAKHIKGNPYSFYDGDEQYRGTCVGCYQYDPVAYRKACVIKISQEVAQDIVQKLYPEE